ncbi:MAG: DUF302 domain-containing protein [Candidatus Marinimicrobia bacterium]|nr:DUF302 domain-containing protein [Candidatus Neomarinimicrobiota bacterium]MCH7859175.1 DUF302 domain-containing protein [Candidatus Neomarinimicrobiota bacterium]
MDLGYHRDMDMTMEAAESRVRATLQEQGFGVLTEIDVQATLKKKLDVDFRPYKILGACDPASAHRALSAVPEIGLLLPCNVTVSQNDDGTVRVAAINALAMLGLVDHPDLAEIAEEVNTNLQKAIDAI